MHTHACRVVSRTELSSNLYDQDFYPPTPIPIEVCRVAASARSWMSNYPDRERGLGYLLTARPPPGA